MGGLTERKKLRAWLCTKEAEQEHKCCRTAGAEECCHPANTIQPYCKAGMREGHYTSYSVILTCAQQGQLFTPAMSCVLAV